MTYSLAFAAGFVYAALCGSLVVWWLRSYGLHFTVITSEEKQRLHHG